MKTTVPAPSRTMRRAPLAGAEMTTGTAGATGAPWRLGPPEPLRTGSSRRSTGPSITRRAIDHASTSAITAATRTDQFGPPRVARMPPLVSELGLEHPARVDRGVGVALVVRRQQRRRIDAEDAREGADVAAGVEVAATGHEVVGLDRLDHVRTDAGALGELVDRQPQAGAGGRELRPDHGLLGRFDREVVDDDGLERLAGHGDRPHALAVRAPALGLDLELDPSWPVQRERLGQAAQGGVVADVGLQRVGARDPVGRQVAADLGTTTGDEVTQRAGRRAGHHGLRHDDVAGSAGRIDVGTRPQPGCDYTDAVGDGGPGVGPAPSSGSGWSAPRAPGRVRRSAAPPGR